MTRVPRTFRTARATRRAMPPFVACCLGAVLLLPASATAESPSKQGSSAGAAAEEPGPYYATNPDGQVGLATPVTVDGEPDEWTPEMIVAQGVANDDPRIFRGSHEGPVYDLYSLSAAWDEEHLYLMWQFTNVTDVTDPSQTYPISDNGKPYAGDIPIALAFDVDPDAATDGLVDGGPDGVWGIRASYAETQGVDHLAMFSSKPAVGEPSLFTLNAEESFDYEEENVHDFEDIGVTFAHGDALTAEEVIGVNDTGNAGYTPEDLTDEANYEDLLAEGHDPEQDTVYEMAIPLEALSLTQEALERDGLGLMLTTTFGESAINSLPHDPAVLDNATEPYSQDESTSMEKEDDDAFTVPFARVGAL